MNITALRHQSSVLNLIQHRKDIPYIFLIGGYGSGKSFSDVILALYLISLFNNKHIHLEEQIHIGILGVTIKLLKQTVIADIERALDSSGYPYKDNTQQGTLTVGNVKFIYLACQDPNDIYAHNFHAAIVDELDEVATERVLPIVTAVQERCRRRIPILDREPFIFFSTTAQGMGGTYNLVQYFKKNKLPYAVIHAHTADNPHISTQQLDLLRKLYTPEEARAYLDGEFVNLTQGRVYWAFARQQHSYASFPITPKDTIYVGQDFNFGFNASVECICRGDRIYVINSHHWLDMREGITTLRSIYPNNDIVMIPDASGKEIMQGFVDECDENDIELYWNTKNPSITERIMAINKAYSFNQLFIFNVSDNDKLLLGMETRDFDDTGKPRKGKGELALDHHCDALEYAIWYIIHKINAFPRILSVLGHTFH